MRARAQDAQIQFILASGSNLRRSDEVKMTLFLYLYTITSCHNRHYSVRNCFKKA